MIPEVWEESPGLFAPYRSLPPSVPGRAWLRHATASRLWRSTTMESLQGRAQGVSAPGSLSDLESRGGGVAGMTTLGRCSWAAREKESHGLPPTTSAPPSPSTWCWTPEPRTSRSPRFTGLRSCSRSTRFAPAFQGCRKPKSPDSSFCAGTCSNLQYRAYDKCFTSGCVRQATKTTHSDQFIFPATLQ